MSQERLHSWLSHDLGECPGFPPPVHHHRFKLESAKTYSLTWDGSQETLYTYVCSDMFCRQHWVRSKRDMWSTAPSEVPD